MQTDETQIKSKPCMCDTHIKIDAGKKDAIPCIGHGEGCPCTEARLEKEGCACSVEGVKHPRFTKHSLYECSNSEGGILKA